MSGVTRGKTDGEGELPQQNPQILTSCLLPKTLLLPPVTSRAGIVGWLCGS